ncbi:MAG: response regulator [Candidatus Eremiobacteraeota bacterium]|nr:response regulator [Candidatus Eremiobacteraeota bacterium]MCW5868917.1 response regulator [Candidatus Eremiobacteraeota bacterium]
MANFRGAHVLVVEDEDSLRSFLRRILERGGYTVTEASNGREALERCSAGTYHLVVTDLDMPEMGGLEMIRNWLLVNPAQCFLVITGRPDRAPADWPWLGKPFQVAQLLDRVEILITKTASPTVLD